MHLNSRSSTNTLLEMNKKKRVLLKDEASDWLQIWMAASSLDVKDKKVIKRKWLDFHLRSHMFLRGGDHFFFFIVFPFICMQAVYQLSGPEY